MATLLVERVSLWPVGSEGGSAADRQRFRVRGDGLYPLIKDGDLAIVEARKRGDLVTGTLLLRERQDDKRAVEVFYEGALRRRLGLHSRWQESSLPEQAGFVDSVVAIERAGRRRQLDHRWARYFQRLCLRMWPLTRLLVAAKTLVSVLDSRYWVVRPHDALASVATKYGDPEEVSYCEGVVAEGLSTEERRLVEHYMVPPGRLLDVGCGAGREAFAFAARGFDVLAIDVAPGMIEKATCRAITNDHRVEFRVLNITNLDDGVGEFDYVFFSEGVYSLIPTGRLRIETLSRAAALLAPGGRILLSALLRRPTYASRIALQGSIFGISKKLIGRPRHFEPGDRMSRHVSPVGDPSKLCYVHLFRSPEEVKEEIGRAGLEGFLDQVSGYWVLASPAAGRLPGTPPSRSERIGPDMQGQVVPDSRGHTPAS
jgi:SAM-dependent methyltransferase